jgi:hypothetical protein
MMAVYVQVPRAGDLKVEEGVAREKIEHVIEKPYPGCDL